MNILEKYNQEQLERFYKDLSKTEQSKLQKEIENIDFEQINSLYINSKKDEVIELKEIEPIKYYIKKKLSKSIIEEYSNLAKESLRRQHQVLQRESYIILETLNPESKQRGCFGLCI